MDGIDIGARRGDLSPAELVGVGAGVAARLDRGADRDGRAGLSVR
jgi:hypothetical protein